MTTENPLRMISLVKYFCYNEGLEYLIVST